VLGSLLTAPEPAARLDAFYARVRPPGFWGRSEARRALGRQLVAVAAAAGTLYGALLGAGVWLVGAPAPLGAPRALFVAAALAAAVALVPVWLRELRGGAAS
jgi:hypothetical protein